ncbi:MAG: S9 family peptidase [Bacteroidia bacterium]
MPSIKKLLLLIIVVAPLFKINAQNASKNLTLQEIWASRTFSSAFVQGGASMNDGLHYTVLESSEKGQSIVKYEYASGKMVSVLFNSWDYTLGGKPLEFEEYTFSADESKILLTTDSEPVYRYSSRSTFVVADLKNKTVKPLAERGSKQTYADFSPDGIKVAFVRDNNLFIKDLNSGEEQAVTNDGKQNEIINGASDWVYEEEFALTRAFFWSPDSRNLAYLKFDERKVKEFNMATYGSLYPGEYRFKYPKAGEDNSVVTVHIYGLSSKKTTTINAGNDPQQYFARLTWNYSGSELCITRLNRLQNHLQLIMADAETGQTRVMLEERSKTYIDVHDNLTFLANGRQFFWTSEKDGWNRAYLYDIQGKEISALSESGSDLTEVYGVDEKNGLFWYQAAWPNPMSRTVFSARLNGKGQKPLIKWTGHQDAQFSATFSYALVTRSQANAPVQFELYSSSGKLLRVLENNSDLLSRLNEYNLSKKEFFKIPNGQGDSLNAWMIKPPDFNPTKKYPIFMTVYGGPGHNTVEDQWEGANYLWHNLLAHKGYIVVSVDNRGTQFRGEAFKKSTYMQLGRYETEDQMAAAKYLGTLNYVDASRIGIQGWSYGGYMSSLCITKGADLFKMAIAVAPVTNWRYYDSIYTERFMQLPQNNAAGYDDNSPINHVARLKGKYLLVHGTADDNVHFQNSVEMVNALVKANKQFDVFFYPDKNHGIYGGNTRLHLYTMMTDYIVKNL